MTSWSWTMSAEETRRALFGQSYVRQGQCDHLPENVNQSSMTYHCGCGKVTMSKEAMQSAPSPLHFLSSLRSLIVSAHEKEGLTWCHECCAFQRAPHAHPKAERIEQRGFRLINLDE